MKHTPNGEATRVARILVPLWFAAVACGGESTAATTMGDDASNVVDAGADTGTNDDAPVGDTGREAATDAAPEVGAFYCASRLGYALVVNTGQGSHRSFEVPCDDARFGPAASLVIGPGTGVSFSLCAMDATGAKVSLSGALAGPTGGTIQVKGAWSDAPGDAVSPAQLDGTVDVTRLGSIGDAVEGTFSVASGAPSPSTLSGSFHVCHQFDDAISRPPTPQAATTPLAESTFCADAGGYYVDLVGDGSTTRFASSCADATVDIGAVGAVGGPFSPHGTSSARQILVEACSDRSEGAAKISIVGGPTTGTTVYLRDPGGKVYLAYNQPQMDPATLRIDPLGGTIEGTFAATLKGDGWVEGPTISGSFRACHLQDVNLVRTP